MSESHIFILTMVISVASLVVAALLARWVLQKDTGTPEMQHISNAIKSGAEAFLRRQNTTIIVFAAILAVLIYLGYGILGGKWELAWRMTVSYIAGAACSVFAGFVGMAISIRANIRTASAARRSLNEALQIALRGGAMSRIITALQSPQIRWCVCAKHLRQPRP